MEQRSTLMKSNTNKRRPEDKSGNITACIKQTACRRYILLVACGLLILFLALILVWRKRGYVPEVYIKTLKNGHYQLMVKINPILLKVFVTTLSLSIRAMTTTGGAIRINRG